MSSKQFPCQAAERYWKQVACVTLYKWYAEFKTLLSSANQLFPYVNGFLLLCIYPCAHLIHVRKKCTERKTLWIMSPSKRSLSPPSSVELKPGYPASVKLLLSLPTIMSKCCFFTFFTIEMSLRRFWINLINAVMFNTALRL